MQFYAVFFIYLLVGIVGGVGLFQLSKVMQKPLVVIWPMFFYVLASVNALILLFRSTADDTITMRTWVLAPVIIIAMSYIGYKKGHEAKLEEEKKQALNFPSRTWTSAKDGSTFEAKYLRPEGDCIILRRQDGKLVKKAIANLSAPDAEYIASIRLENGELPHV